MRALPVLLLLAAVFGGCTASDPTDSASSSTVASLGSDSLYHQSGFSGQGVPVQVAYAPGALSTLTNLGSKAVQVTLPDHTFLVRSDDPEASFSLPTGAITVDPGRNLTFLPAPAAHRLQLTVDGSVLTVDTTTLPPSSQQAISGESMIQLEEVQEARFPHRTPGYPNYAKAIQYFAQYFRDLGYEVEVDPYGTVGVTDTTGCVGQGAEGRVCADSVANIVATKRGTTDPGKVIFVSGGHYDMVPATTHAAFDDTSGTVATMELARALAPYKFHHTLKFALWGGEENGILGSSFWLQTHPEARAQVLSYWNLDVIGMSWPTPVLDPAPVVIAAGPDSPTGAQGQSLGPIADSLLGFARTLQTEWFGFPDQHNGSKMWYYEGIASGQATGFAKVNAQSDHTPFAAAGIPAYFIFNGETLRGNPIGIHNERDTLDNMTKVALLGDEADLKTPGLPPDQMALARDALARSFEATILFPYYAALLTDAGAYTPPALAAQVPG
ncbi:MAG TPA: M28 family peptidase [Candidatus Thermoplasmatota archaeon]|nr:M28 family peptidase [Candidatus Thermoplasmatota archaeon]